MVKFPISGLISIQYSETDASLNRLVSFISIYNFHFLIENLCQKFDKLCTQICENTDNSYVCSCYDGYVLLEDKRTCVPAGDSAEDNDVNYNGSE